MGKVNATDRDGKQYQLEGRDRTSLMEILRQGGLSLEVLCGGSCLCATCHIYVEPVWLDKLLPATEAETFTLQDEAEDIQSNSRLSCQIQWHEGLAGIQLTIAPEIQCCSANHSGISPYARIATKALHRPASHFRTKLAQM